MPFQPTTTPPGDQITVLFKGLLVLSTLADGSCEIGVDRITDDHFLIIEIRRRTGGDRLVMRHAGPLTRDFVLRVDPPLNPNPGVFAFQADTRPFNRASATNDPQDFRWKIDLHDRDFFHPPDTLQKSVPELSPRVLVSNGTFFTFKLTRRIPAFSIPPGIGTPAKDLQRLAAVIGAGIQLDDLHVLRVEGDDVPNPLSLPIPGDPAGTKYEVSILNEPPAIGTPSDADELSRYYDVLRQKPAGTTVPPGQRFKIQPSPFRRTDEIPCMPTVLGP